VVELVFGVLQRMKHVARALFAANLWPSLAFAQSMPILNPAGDVYNDATSRGTLRLSAGAAQANLGLSSPVVSALQTAIGTPGSIIINGGAGGTPSSLNLSNASGLPTTGLTGPLQAAQEPAHTGDVTNTAGSLALTLATVNAGSGAVGSSTAIPVLTTNAKGLVTAQSTAAVVAPAGTLTGSTLSAGVTASSLTSVGALTAGAVPSNLLTGTLQSAQAPALTGDVISSAGSLATTITSGAVTASKLAPGAAASNLTALPACHPGATTAPVATGLLFQCGGLVLIAQ
jgi:hypothetical protein